MIRYYGIYARNNKYKNKFFKLVNEKIAMELKKLRKWEYRLLKAFGIDPLKCEKCGSTMHLDGIYFNKTGNLIEKYKRDLLNKVKLKVEELIPEDVVNYFDTLDDGDTSVPPRFTCEECSEIMEPVEYKGVHGITYKIEN